MEESRDIKNESEGCTCKRKEPPKRHPDKNESVRRLIKALEEELETYAQKEVGKEAVTAFQTELKDADKEYQGIDALVSSYRKYYDKLECGTLPDARQGKDDLAAWCKEKVPQTMQGKIRDLRQVYLEKEKAVCCKWLRLRGQLFNQSDCLTQAAKTVSDAKDDYEAHKGFEKTLGTRFTALKSLHEKATKLRQDGKHQSVCAVKLEYDVLFEDLGVVHTWEYQQKECKKSGGACTETSSPSDPCPEKFHPTPEQFAEGLTQALRKLIEDKYQHFRWSHEKLETEAASKKNKEACTKARETRSAEFIQEAQDVKTSSSATSSADAFTPDTSTEVAQNTPTDEAQV